MTNNNRQYGKMFFDLLEELDPSQVVTYTLIHDRMNSSVVRRDFYDRKVGRHYVILPLEELAKKLHSSEKTAGKVVKSLVKRGYLTIKKQYSKANKIFIPDFNEESALTEIDERAAYNSITEDFTGTYQKNVPSNQSTLNQTNTLTSNTVNTGNCENTQESVQGQNESFDVFSWIDSTVRGFSMDRSIPEVVAKYSQYYDNPKEFCYDTIGVISNVRASIAKKCGVDNSKKSQFDSNANFGTKLANKVRSVFVHAIAKKIEKAEDVMKYLNKSLQEFFKQATGFGMAIASPTYAPEMNVPVQTQPQQKQSKPMKKNIEPAWLKDFEEEEHARQEAKKKQERDEFTYFAFVKQRDYIKNYISGNKRSEESTKLVNSKITELLKAYGIDPNATTPEAINSNTMKLINSIIEEVGMIN